MEPHEYHGKLFLTGISTVLIIIFLALTAVVLVVFKSRSVSPPAGGPNTTTQQAPQNSAFQGKMTMQPQDGQTNFRMGDTITVTIIADSGSSEIVGYDAALLVSPGAEFVSAVSLFPDFDVRTTTKNETVIATGFKKLNAAGGSVFTNTPLASLTFRLTGSGAISFFPQLTLGQKTQSNLIDDKNNNVLTSVEGVEITVN